MSPLETYLREMAEIRGPGVPETSFYPPFRNLLNAVGDTLKPKVRCIINLKNKGAGIPDGGLFTADLLKKNANIAPLEGLPPDRGAIEVKPVNDDAWLVADSGHVLVTNYRDFVMVGRDSRGKPVILETYRLADNAAAFWSSAATPRKTADLHSERFLEYLKRVMLHAAPISAPQDIAWFLASYARDARIRIEQQPDLPALAAVRTALEEALGLKFQGAKGEHFFRSTLVQTLFYGIFSAWVLWHREDPLRKDRFDWATASRYLRVPVLRKLFYQVADPSQLEELKLSEVLDWAVTVLNRVDRKSFFAAFTTGHEIQYFYEPFLKAFDPELRKQLGVWYTPTEIVQYQVARVDTVLREELGIADGLADKRVYVLDPCCGTGAYLVEVLRHIAATLKDKQGGALCAAEVKKAATERVFGFEILPAPFVVAHLQLGLLLQGLGVPLTDKSRVAVYLTNALTGWEPPKDPKQHLLFKEFEEERDAANHVKQSERILVILGNPPYNGFAGVAVGEERDLSNAYRTTKKVAPPKGQGLNELYVRFFRRELCLLSPTTRGSMGYHIRECANGIWKSSTAFGSIVSMGISSRPVSSRRTASPTPACFRPTPTVKASRSAPPSRCSSARRHTNPQARWSSVISGARPSAGICWYRWLRNRNTTTCRLHYDLVWLMSRSVWARITGTGFRLSNCFRTPPSVFSLIETMRW
jgi:hypothetical protein